MEPKRARLAIHGGLAASTLLVYGRVLGFDFVGFDDPGYVSNNSHVQAGLTLDGLAWAFSTTAQANWHPLTWLSLMLDATLGGGRPGVFHLTNLLLHVANAMLTFEVLLLLTGARWRSAFVAAVFAVHPLHVESVAWVAERKDVLSTLFWLLTLLAYGRYASRPSLRNYMPVVLAFAAGLLTKPMLVTLPLVLLLLDVWPLGRFRTGSSAWRWGPLLDKLPLVALAGASSVMTLYAQSSGGAVGTLTSFPLEVRSANAVVAYAAYMAKMFWPSGLAVPYPYRVELLTPLLVGGCATLLVGLTVLAFAATRKQPWFAVGWTWFGVTLLPVIGLIQVGTQARADRYTYVPLTGLLIIVAWGAPQLLQHAVRDAPTRRRILATAAGISLLSLMATAYVQVGYWRDTTHLLGRALAVTENNAVAHNGLGLVRYDAGDSQGALEHFDEALRLSPGYVTAHMNRAAALIKSGQVDAAVATYGEALRLRPDDPVIRLSLSDLLVGEGRPEEAVTHLEQALRLDEDDVEARVNLATALMNAGDGARAKDEFERALEIDPGHTGAYKNLGVLLARSGRLEQALVHFREALRLDPNDAGTRKNMERAEAMLDAAARSAAP